MSDVVLVRHGATEWSDAGKHTGRTDVPLNAAGEAAAARLRACLGRWTFGRVLTSPLVRARETCRLAGYGDRAEVLDDLVEWDYGEYDGRTTKEIRETRSGWSLWRDGAPGGESAADVGARADRVLEALRDPGGDVLVFAHGHFLRVLAARWVGLEPEWGSAFALEPAALGVLGHEREVPVLSRWNEPCASSASVRPPGRLSPLRPFGVLTPWSRPPRRPTSG